MIIHQKPDKNYTIGGKAAGLFKLQALNLPVPSFLVIPAEVFDNALKHQLTQPFNLETARQQLLEFTLPEREQQEIKTILEAWGFPQKAVVVRSSVADEDGETAAFPGLMDSFMNLQNWAAVTAAIGKCAASAFSERAIVYRAQKKLSLQARPAVIIQEQVLPRASGVLFTTFPEYPQELAIHATLGFGESLVSGQVAPDEYYFLKSTGKLNRQVIVTKARQLVPHHQSGLEEISVPAALTSEPSLTIIEAEQLFSMGTRLEKDFSKPLDIEFVVQEGGIFVVQARPVTQAIPEVVVYDNSNIQESYCGVTTPLTFAFASRAYATVYRQTMRALGLPALTIAQQEPVVTQLLGLVKGRIYYNINNWYRGLQLLPAFRQNKADMERMMGVEEPVDFVQDAEKPVLQKIKMLPGLVLNLMRLLWAFRKMPRLVQSFHEQFQRFYTWFYQQDLTQLQGKQLWKLKEKLDRELLQNWTTPILNDFFVMMNNGDVIRDLKKLGIQETDEFLSRLLAGAMQLESTQPTHAMQALAQRARQTPTLLALINSAPTDLHEQIQNQFPAFYQEVDTFINRYGDRTVGELKLETLTMRVAPQVLYNYLRNYLTPDAALPPTPKNQLHLAAELELKQLLKGKSKIKQKRVWRRLQKLQQSIQYRESLRLERTRLFGMYRALFRAMGTYLTKKLPALAAEDIFYLTETEIEGALINPAPALINQVQNRKAEFNFYKTEDVPARVIIPSPPQAASAKESKREDALLGTGCYPGVVTGEAVVITEPTGDLGVRDKIICALRTDPGWAALFPACKGVLIEKGSSLSHSVIILRELGIPTIINIPALTKTIQTGQQILIDGATGRIQLINHPADGTDTI